MASDMLNKKLSEKLEGIIEREVEREQTAGANILVLQNGREVAYAQAGYADLEEKKPYQRDTIVRLYSMTKPVTAAAVMLLADRGELDLNQGAEEFIPEFRNIKVDENGTLTDPVRRIRIYDLLHMTSGLCYGGDESAANIETEKVFQEIIERMDTEDAVTTVEAAKRLAGCPLRFQPREQFLYGSSADVLGAVIEIVSGRRLSKFCREELFEPLGMKDTGFYVPEEKQSRLAKVYESTAEGMKLFTGRHLGISNRMERLPAFESGGAGLVSTVDDYARFAQMLMQGGTFEGRKIMEPGTVKLLTQGKLQPWQQDYFARTWEGLDGYSYANLMRVMTEPGLACLRVSEGEYGWDGWLGNYFANSPKDGITMLATCQKRDAGTTSMVRKLKNVVWNSLVRDCRI